MQSDAKHGGVAALDAEGDIDRAPDPVHRADVPGRALPLIVGLRFVLIIVAVVLQLQDQRLPGCLVLHTAEQGGWTPKIAPESEIATGGAIAGFSRIERWKQAAQRVAQVSSPADITPAQTEAPIERASALAPYQIFTRPKSGTRDVAKAERDLGHIGRFRPKPEFGVEALVQIRLVATEVRVRAVEPVAHGAVAKPRLQPVHGLHHDVALEIRIDAAEVDREIAGLLHTCARRLQQPNATPIARRGRQTARARGRARRRQDRRPADVRCAGLTSTPSITQPLRRSTKLRQPGRCPRLRCPSQRELRSIHARFGCRIRVCVGGCGSELAREWRGSK